MNNKELKNIRKTIFSKLNLQISFEYDMNICALQETFGSKCQYDDHELHIKCFWTWSRFQDLQRKKIIATREKNVLKANSTVIYITLEGYQIPLYTIAKPAK